MTIRIRGAFKGAKGLEIDSTAGQIAYNEGIQWDQTNVAHHKIHELVLKLSWQGRLLDRVLVFVDQSICKNERDQIIDLPTQVRDLTWIVFASRNMENVTRKFASTPQEQWKSGAVSDGGNVEYIINVCNGLKKDIDLLEQVIVEKKTARILKNFFIDDVVGLISEYLFIEHDRSRYSYLEHS